MRWLFVQREDSLKPVYSRLLSHGHAIYVCVERHTLPLRVWKANHPTSPRTLRACGYVVDVTDAVNSVWNSIITKPGFATFDSMSTPLAIARALCAEGVHSHVPVVNWMRTPHATVRALRDQGVHSHIPVVKLDAEQQWRITSLLKLDAEQLWRVTSLSTTKTTPSPCSYHVDFVYRAPPNGVERVPCAVLHNTLLQFAVTSMDWGDPQTLGWQPVGPDYTVVDTLHPTRAACDTTAALAQYAFLKSLAEDDREWAGVLAEVDACSVTTAFLTSCRPWSSRDHRKHDKTVQRRVFTVYVCAARFEARTAFALPAELWESILGTTSLI